MDDRHVGRNNPCPCGSGKKYKTCCLQMDRQQAWPSLLLPSRRVDTRRVGYAQTCPSQLPVNAGASEGDSLPSAKRWNEVFFDAPLAQGGRLHVVLLYSDTGLRNSPFRSGGIVTLDLPDVPFRGPATVVRIQPSAGTAEIEGEVLRVVRFRHDDDLGTLVHGEWEPPPEFVEQWRNRRREVVLRLDYPDGSWCDMCLLRTVDWIAEMGAQPDGTIFLDLAEVGTRGWAKVLEILPCGPVEFGPGDMVTGTFRHSHGQIGELVLESEPEPLGVTPGHMIWSVDRQAWVPVCQLRPGETLKTWTGFTRVVSYTVTDCVEPVYNLEVEGSHCYRVGESGVLVHNMSAACLGNLDEPIDPCNLEVDPRSTTHKVFRDKTARKPPDANEVAQADELSTLLGGKEIALARKKNNAGVDGCIVDDDRPIQLTEIASAVSTRLIDKYNRTLQVASSKWKNILLFAKTPKITKADLLDRWQKTGPTIVPQPKASGGVVTRVFVVAMDGTIDLPVPP